MILTMVTCFILVSVGLLVVLLRAVAAGARIELAEDDPICETCGYNLSHTPTDSRCPECGEQAALSRPPGIRRPPAWEQPGRWLRVRDYVRCSAAALFRPGRFFRTMPTQAGHGRARTAVILNLILASLILTGSMMALSSVERSFYESSGMSFDGIVIFWLMPVSYTHLRAHET